MAISRFRVSRLRCRAGFALGFSSLMAAFALVWQARAELPSGAPQAITFDTRGEDTFHSLVRLASERRLPAGIVLDPSGDLCNAPQISRFDEATLSEVMSGLLANSASEWFSRNGILEIRPNRISEAETHVLNMRFDTFNSMRTTIQGLGVILAGYVQARLSPGAGLAGDILSSSDSETIPPFALHNVSAEEIADYIASRGKGGAWLLYDSGTSSAERSSTLELKAYGYRDDSSVLEKMACPAMSRRDN